MNLGVKDINLIEEYLDSLLGIPTDKCYQLFMMLCEYYSSINRDNAKFYLDLYNELYLDDSKILKK